MPHVVSRLEHGPERSNLTPFRMRLRLAGGCHGERGECSSYENGDNSRTVHGGKLVSTFKASAKAESQGKQFSTFSQRLQNSPPRQRMRQFGQKQVSTQRIAVY